MNTSNKFYNVNVLVPSYATFVIHLMSQHKIEAVLPKL